MIFDIIKKFKDHYSSPDRVNDVPQSHQAVNAKIVDMLDMIERMIMKSNFSIEGVYVDGVITDDVDNPFLIKELEEFYIIQPLAILTCEELEALHASVVALSERVGMTKPFLILPFDIKLVRAKIKRRVIDDGTTSNVGECIENPPEEMS